jgi:hypothetical protein
MRSHDHQWGQFRVIDLLLADRDHGIPGMTTQEEFSTYGPGAFGASSIPTLAPAKEEHPGLMDRPLAWGYYAGLDSAVEIDHQLEAELHIISERQQQEKGNSRFFAMIKDGTSRT